MEPMINEMFQSMYETYQESLRIIAMHYKIPRDDIDDIVQETFISYYEHYPVNMSNRKSMLTTILIRKCLDYWRKYRPESISMDSEEGKIEVGNLLHLVSKDIADTVVDKEKYKRLYDCIMEMRDDWKEVILSLRLNTLIHTAPPFPHLKNQKRTFRNIRLLLDY